MNGANQNYIPGTNANSGNNVNANANPNNGATQQQFRSSQITSQDRMQFIKVLLNTLQKIQGQNFNLQKVKPVTEEFEKYAFSHSRDKAQYADFLKSKITTLTQTKRMQQQQQQQQQQQLVSPQIQQQPQQQQQEQPGVAPASNANPPTSNHKIDLHTAPIPKELLAKLPKVFPSHLNTWQAIMPYFKDNHLSQEDLQTIRNIHAMHVNSFKQSYSKSMVDNQRQLLQQQQQQQQISSSNSSNAPVNSNTHVSNSSSSASLNPQQILMMSRQRDLQAQQQAQLQAQLKAQQQAQMQIQIQTQARLQAQSNQQNLPTPVQQPNQQNQISQAKQAQINAYKAQAIHVIRKLQSMGKLSANLTPEKEAAYIKKYLVHILQNASNSNRDNNANAGNQQIPGTASQQQSQNRNLSQGMQQVNQQYPSQSANNNLQPIAMKSNGIDMNNLSSPVMPMQNIQPQQPQNIGNFSSPLISNQQLASNQQPQYNLHQSAQRKQQILSQNQQQLPIQNQPQQRQLPTHSTLPTNQNQNQFGNINNPQYPTASTNTGATGPKLLPGLKATPADWAALKEIYRETLKSPVNLKDVTNNLSDDDKRKVLAQIKHSKQLMILCQSIIIPNFYFLTKQKDATKRIMYSELMLKQILEKLGSAGRYVADESLLTKIHDQIKKYLQFVKDQSGKLAKAQVQAQQIKAQQIQQQQMNSNTINNNAPPQGTFNQLPPNNMDPSSMQKQLLSNDNFMDDLSQLNMQRSQARGVGQVHSTQLQSQTQNFSPMLQTASLNTVSSSTKSLTPQTGLNQQPKKAVPKRRNTKTGKISAPVTPATIPTPTAVTSASANSNVPTKTTPTASAAVAINSAEIQAVLKANNENIEREEIKLKAIDAARNRRRALVGQTSTATGISGAASYLLATLCDTLGLENEEKNLLANIKSDTAGGILGHFRSKSTGGKVLTPSAVLATPVALDAKTPLHKFPTSLPPDELRLMPWNGKVSASCISQAFKPVLNSNLNSSPEMLLNTAISINNTGSVSGPSNASSKTMSGGVLRTMVELTKEKLSKNKTMSVLFAESGMNWIRDADGFWKWGKDTDKANSSNKLNEFYPTPPEDFDSKKRKNSPDGSVSADLKRVKVEDSSIDLFWDFDKV